MNATELIDRYCAVWNEPDPRRREAALAECWAANATYTDPSVHAPDAAALLDHIAAVRARRPGATVRRTSGVDLHHGTARFAWHVALADGSTLPEGLDLALLSGDGSRIERIVGFFGPLPAMSPDLKRLLCTLKPRRNPGVYVYALAAPGTDTAALQPVASVREREGTTLIVEESFARAAGLEVRYRVAWLTLEVQSQLSDVGLTAAIAQALSAANIACNVVAAVHHDHLFVPLQRADAAMAVLQALQTNAAGVG